MPQGLIHSGLAIVNFSPYVASKGLPFDINLHYFKLNSFMPLSCRFVSRVLERGGPISLGSLKKSHQILKRGVQWSDGGGSSTLVSLG